MRILITGDGGFIGSHLSDAFRKKGKEVLGWRRNGIYENGRRYMYVDLMDFSDVCKAIEEYSPDLILHCAGCADVGRSFAEPYMDLKNNYLTTHNLLFAIKETGLFDCRFILMSSAAVYGNPYILPISEIHGLDPLSPYALHKKAAEDICLYMQKKYGVDTKVLRIFSAYGPGLKKQLFWDMYKKITNTGGLDLLGSGDESRDYIYIDDLVQAIILVSEKAPQEEIFYNIANCEEIKIKVAADIFAECWDLDKNKIHFTGDKREGDPINWKGDIRKLLSLGYVRKVTFKDGVRQYVEWVKGIDIGRP